jgi:hypothetical protein
MKAMSAVCISGLLFTSATLNTHAAYSDSFDALRAELVTRVSTLTGSVDKVEQKQGKTCLKVIAAIDKSTTLAGDIKTATKVAKTLGKAFPNEFINPIARGTGVVEDSIVPDLSELVDAVFFDLADAIDEAIAVLLAGIHSLPEGSDRTKAQAAYDAAVAALEAAETPFLAGDYAGAAKLLSSALKNQIKGQATVDNASGGGGGDSTSLTMLVDSVAWNAETFIGVDYVSTTGEFALGGTRNSAPESVLVIIIPAGVNGPGTYSLAGNGFYQVGIFPTIPTIYNITSGSMTITTLNGTTAAGTFSFSASDGSTTISVTQGAFTAPVSQ